MKKFHCFMRTLLFPADKVLMPCKVMDKDLYKKYDGGQIIISNHLSWLDVAYVYYGVPGYKRMLSKKENAGSKLKHAFLRAIGLIFVNREKPELSSMRECLTSLKNGETLTIFPEGTRNKTDRSLQPMHSGTALFALKSHARVVPIVIHHKGKLFKRNYAGVGDEVDLSDLYDKRVDEAVLQEATERFKAALQNTLDKLDKWVAEKGYKHAKNTQKSEQKLLDKQYKEAEKSVDKNTDSK